MSAASGLTPLLGRGGPVSNSDKSFASRGYRCPRWSGVRNCMASQHPHRLIIASISSARPCEAASLSRKSCWEANEEGGKPRKEEGRPGQEGN